MAALENVSCQEERIKKKKKLSIKKEVEEVTRSMVQWEAKDDSSLEGVGNIE